MLHGNVDEERLSFRRRFADQAGYTSTSVGSINSTTFISATFHCVKLTAKNLKNFCLKYDAIKREFLKQMSPSSFRLDTFSF